MPKPSNKVQQSRRPGALLVPPDVAYAKAVEEGGKPLWAPYPGFQTECLLTPATEILLAGEKGSGKSDISRQFIIKGNPDLPLYDKTGKPIEVNHSYAYHPKYVALVVRRNQDDLKDWLEHARPIYESMGAWLQKQPFTFFWPSGARLYTGHLADSNSWGKYVGNELHRIVLEEAVLIADPASYTSLFSCLRSKYRGIRPQAMLTCNPRGPGVGWIKERFLQTPQGLPVQSGELQEISSVDKRTGTEYKSTRIWYFGRLKDNPTMDTPEYRAKLLQGTEDQIRAYAYGEWDAQTGSYFPQFRRIRKKDEPENAWHVRPAHLLPEPRNWERRVIGADWGYGHHAAAVLFEERTDGVVVARNGFSYPSLSTFDFGAMMAQLVLKDLPNLDVPVLISLSPDTWAAESEIESESKRILLGIGKVVGPHRVIREDDEDPQDTRFSKPGMIVVRRAPNSRRAGWTLFSELLVWRQMELEKKVYEFSKEEAQKIFQNQGDMAYQSYMRAWERSMPEVRPKLLFEDRPEFELLFKAIERAQHSGKSDGDIAKEHFDGMDYLDAARYGLMAIKYMPQPENERLKKRRQLEDMITAARTPEDKVAIFRMCQQMEREKNLPTYLGGSGTMADNPLGFLSVPPSRRNRLIR
jgi:hypothetical protein